MITDTKAAAPRPSVITVLERARAQVSKGWTQGAAARDALGAGVERSHPSAIQWCLIAALHPASVCESREACGLVARAIGGSVFEINRWNDATGRTLAEVLSVLDRALAVERGTAPEGSP